MKNVEDVVVFYAKQCAYNPQMTEGRPNHVKDGAIRESKTNNCYGEFKSTVQKATNQKYPKQIQMFKQQDPNKILHPTQKPVALMEYLIKTYTNEGETVLDFAAGSFTTGVACVNLDRKFIGIELDKDYFDIGVSRVNGAGKMKKFNLEKANK